MIRFLRAWLAVVSVLFATTVFAQGGGASTTGSIQGRVTDSSGGVLPGVTVTAASPSLIGMQTQVTTENGSYRFPNEHFYVLFTFQASRYFNLQRRIDWFLDRLQQHTPGYQFLAADHQEVLTTPLGPVFRTYQRDEHIPLTALK